MLSRSRRRGEGAHRAATYTGPACSTADVTFQVHAADESFIVAPISDRVTVRSVDRCVNGVCATQSLYASTDLLPDNARRVILARAASSDALTLYLHIPGMPDTYFAAGDVFDLALIASVDSIFMDTINQTLTLSRDGRVMVLGVNMASFQGPPLQGLDQLVDRLRHGPHGHLRQRSLTAAFCQRVSASDS